MGNLTLFFQYGNEDYTLMEYCFPLWKEFGTLMGNSMLSFKHRMGITH